MIRSIMSGWIILLQMNSCEHTINTSGHIPKIQPAQAIQINSSEPGTLQTKDTLQRFDTLNDHTIISEVFSNLVYLDSGWASIFEKDTVFFPEVVGSIYTTSVDTIYLLELFTNEIYTSCHFVKETQRVILQKQKNKWVVTETGYGIQPSGIETEVSVIGPYIVFQEKTEVVYCGGFFHSNEMYSIIYNGKNAYGFGFERSANNYAFGCNMKEEDNQEWECSCYDHTGTGTFEYQKDKALFLFNSIETQTKFSGTSCEDSTVTKKITKVAFCKGAYTTLEEIEITDGSKKIITQHALKDFLLEMKKKSATR